MEFKAVSLFVLLTLTICIKGNAQDISPVTAKPFCPIYLGILQSEANKINTPDLPVDLQLKINDVLTNAELGCASCDGLVVWLNKLCLVANLRAGLNQLSQIKAEADARATPVPAAF